MEGPVFGVICVLLGLLVHLYRQRTAELREQERREFLQEKRKRREAEEEDISEAITLDLPQVKKRG